MAHARIDHVLLGEQVPAELRGHRDGVRLPARERARPDAVVVRREPPVAARLPEVFTPVDRDDAELALLVDGRERLDLRADGQHDGQREDDVRPDPPALPVAEARQLRERVRRRLARVEDREPEEALRVAERREHGELAEQREQRRLAGVAGGEPEEDDDDDERLDRFAVRAAEGDEREERRADVEAPGIGGVAVFDRERLDEEEEQLLRRVARRPGHDPRLGGERLGERQEADGGRGEHEAGERRQHGEGAEATARGLLAQRARGLDDRRDRDQRRRERAAEADHHRERDRADDDPQGAPARGERDAVEDERDELEAEEVRPPAEVRDREVPREREHRRDPKRRRAVVHAEPDPAVRAFHPHDREEEDDEELGALDTEEEAQQERRRGEAALRLAEPVDAAAVPGIPERQLAEAADRVDGGPLVEREHLRVAELVEPRRRRQERPDERQREEREEREPDGRSFREASHPSVVEGTRLARDRAGCRSSMSSGERAARRWMRRRPPGAPPRYVPPSPSRAPRPGDTRDRGSRRAATTGPRGSAARSRSPTCARSRRCRRRSRRAPRASPGGSGPAPRRAPRVRPPRPCRRGRRRQRGGSFSGPSP